MRDKIITYLILDPVHGTFPAGGSALITLCGRLLYQSEIVFLDEPQAQAQITHVQFAPSILRQTMLGISAIRPWDLKLHVIEQKEDTRVCRKHAKGLEWSLVPSQTKKSQNERC